MRSPLRLSRAEIEAFEKPDVRFHGSLFSLSVFSLAGGRGALSVCVVPKKIIPGAVGRNRVRRLCREAVRQHLKALPGSMALVFRARRDAVHAAFADVERDIASLVGKIPGARYNTSQ